MKLLIYSDLHLEFGTDFMPPADIDADIMILAGDITIFNAKGLEKLTKFLVNWEKPVLYVAGNHEYYTKQAMQNGNIRCLNYLAARHPNVTFLQDEEITIDGVNFFAGTMWTNYRDANPMAMALCHQGMNDYRLIINGDKELTPRDTIDFHNKYVENLINWFEKDLPGSRVVISHHAPCINPNGFHRGSPMQPAYNSLDMIPIIEKYKPALWFYGHTHEPDDQIIGETRIISNPRGYPLRGGGQECKGFKEDGVGIII